MLGVVGQQCCVRLHAALFRKKITLPVANLYDSDLSYMFRNCFEHEHHFIGLIYIYIFQNCHKQFFLKKLMRHHSYVSVSKLQGIVMSRQSGFENMGTVFSSLEILQEPEIRKDQLK